MKTQVKVIVSNYKQVTMLANFGRNFHDAVRFLRLLQFDQLRFYGRLSEDIFYYIEYTTKGQVKTFAFDIKEIETYTREVEQQLTANLKSVA